MLVVSHTQCQCQLSCTINQTDRQIDGHRSLKIEEAMLQPHQPFTTQLENETNVDDGDDELKEIVVDDDDDDV